jgi:superfamily II DNA or RNA helicase
MTTSSSFAKFVPTFVPQTDEDVQFQIANRKEFEVLSAQANEPTPERGELYNHQKSFRRLMMLYDRMLLIAEPGTGKSISFLAVAEKLKETGLYDGCVIFENSVSLIGDVRNQLVYKATKTGVYETDMVRRAKDRTTKEAAITRELKKGSFKYEFLTYHRLASDFETNKKDFREYSGNLIVFDEVHNVTGGGSKSSRYLAAQKLIREAKRSKIIIVTATPMLTSPSELKLVMNLILPEERAFPPRFSFGAAGAMDEVRNRTLGYVSYVRKDATKSKMVEVGKSFPIKTSAGIDVDVKVEVSYMERLQEDVYKNKKPKSIASKRIFERAGGGAVDASDEELDDEEASPARAVKKGGESLYKDAIQTSLFVFPDRKYGGTVEGIADDEGGARGTGVEKYLEMDADGNLRFKASADQEFSQNKIAKGAKTFKGWLAGKEGSMPADAPPTANLAKLSAKFAKIINIEMGAMERGLAGCGFIYSEYKNGGGALLLSACFELFGFERFTIAGLTAAAGRGDDDKVDETGEGNDEEITAAEQAKTATTCGALPSKKLRHALLIPGSLKEQSEILRVFNSPENWNGEYIRVLIGSKISRDGINVYNCTRGHLLSPPWTESAAIQAAARIMRATSHDVLFKKKKEVLIRSGRLAPDANQETIDNAARIEVSLFKHVAMPRDEDVPSVDLLLYYMQTNKDVTIRRVMNELKRSAIDCVINYKRNVTSPLASGAISDNTSSCDYKPCLYACGNTTLRKTARAVRKAGEYQETYQIYESFSPTATFAAKNAALRQIRALNESPYSGVHPTDKSEIATRTLTRELNMMRVAYDVYERPSFLALANDASYFLTPDIDLAAASVISFPQGVDWQTVVYSSKPLYSTRRTLLEAAALLFGKGGGAELLKSGDTSKYDQIVKSPAGEIQVLETVLSTMKESRIKKYPIAGILKNIFIEDIFRFKALELKQTVTEDEAALENATANLIAFDATSDTDEYVIHTAIVAAKVGISTEHAKTIRTGSKANVSLGPFDYEIRMAKVGTWQWRYAVYPEEALAIRRAIRKRGKEVIGKAVEAAAAKPDTTEKLFFTEDAKGTLRIVDNRISEKGRGRVCASIDRYKLVGYALIMNPRVTVAEIGEKVPDSKGRIDAAIQNEGYSGAAIAFFADKTLGFTDVRKNISDAGIQETEDELQRRIYSLGLIDREIVCKYLSLEAKARGLLLT